MKEEEAAARGRTWWRAVEGGGGRWKAVEGGGGRWRAVEGGGRVAHVLRNGAVKQLHS